MALSAGANAFSKTPAEEAAEARDEYFKNLNVGGIDLGFKGGPQILKNLQGKPVFDGDSGGLIRGSMGQVA
jgi:hypothetical protein